MKLRWVNPIRIVKEWAYKNPAMSRLLHWMDSFRFWITPFVVRANQRIQNRVVPFLKEANARLQEFRIISHYAFPFIAAGVLFVYGYAMYGMLGAAMLALAAYFVSILMVTMLPYGPIIIGLVLLGSIARGVTMFTLLKGPQDLSCTTCGASWDRDYFIAHQGEFFQDKTTKEIKGCPHKSCTYWDNQGVDDSIEVLRKEQEQSLLMRLVNPNGKTITEEECLDAVGKWIETLEAKMLAVKDKDRGIDSFCNHYQPEGDGYFSSSRDACAQYIAKNVYPWFENRKTKERALMLFYGLNIVSALRESEPNPWIENEQNLKKNSFLEIQARHILGMSQEGDVLALYRNCEAADAKIAKQNKLLGYIQRWRDVIDQDKEVIEQERKDSSKKKS